MGVGYIDPGTGCGTSSIDDVLFVDDFAGANGSPWNPAKWIEAPEYPPNGPPTQTLQDATGVFTYPPYGSYQDIKARAVIPSSTRYMTLTGSVQQPDGDTNPWIYIGKYLADAVSVNLVNALVTLTIQRGDQYTELDSGPWAFSTAETFFKVQTLPGLARAKLWTGATEPDAWTVSGSTPIDFPGYVYLYGGVDTGPDEDWHTVWRDIKIVEHHLTPLPAYDQFVHNSYYTYENPFAAPAGEQSLPLAASEGVVVVLPDGWTIEPEAKLNVPPGVYAMTWYWESSGYTGDWDNYAVISGLESGGSIYPTAPKANPNGQWGSASATVKLGAGAFFSFEFINLDDDPHDVYSVITVLKLG